MKKIPLSVAIITLNEEERLPECLASLADVDEVVVVDSGSQDKTLEIAKNYGAKVLKKDWCGFGPQKQFAIDQCTNEWILILDADERLPAETFGEITDTIQKPAFDTYKIPRKNYFSGRWIRGMGWWPDKVLRLFRKNKGYMSNHLVHESVLVDGETGSLSKPIIHLTNRNLHQTLEKINLYSSIGAEELYAQGARSSTAKALLRGSWAFFYNYFFRLGLLDGPQGLIIAVSDGVTKFFKYTKLQELWAKSKED